jgi:hypothetical protein
MAQLSRPYQVVIVLVAVLALAWFTVLHSHISPSSSGSSAGSSHGPLAAKAGATQSNAGRPTRVYHGAAPGLKGLSKDIRKAHEAVVTANAQTQKLQAGTGSSTAPSVKRSVAQPASGAHVSHSAHAVSGAGARARTRSRTSASHALAHRRAHAGAGRSEGASHHRAAVSRAEVVAGQLRKGKVVLLLFWKRSSFDDRAVHSQVQAASDALGRKVATDYAKPGEVGAFGTVTRDVSVVQTPTLLIINRKGLVTTITGLTDSFAIEQAVREASA